MIVARPGLLMIVNRMEIKTMEIIAAIVTALIFVMVICPVIALVPFLLIAASEADDAGRKAAPKKSKRKD